MDKELMAYLTASEKEQVDGIMAKATKRKEESEKQSEERVRILYGHLEAAAEAAGKRPCEIANKLWNRACSLRPAPVCGPCALCDEELPF